jgi:HD-GYP domain-containing protein (c-di-GMP phosphodiesterase class II)
VAHVGNDSGRRWKSFSRASLLVSAIVVAIPIGVSAAVASALSHFLPRPHTVLLEVLWWIGVLGTAGLAAIGASRLSRRLLPLAALLNMSMLFPDKAPSRLAVLRKMGSTRSLDRQVQSGEVSPDSDLNNAAIEILALATALGQHDRRTRGHSERVRSFADLIADEMRLSQDDRDRLRWSALLHDIGKMTVHPDILNKAGKPTDEEWATLRQHPLEGRRLIAPLQAGLGTGP